MAVAKRAEFLSHRRQDFFLGLLALWSGEFYQRIRVLDDLIGGHAGSLPQTQVLEYLGYQVILLNGKDYSVPELVTIADSISVPISNASMSRLGCIRVMS